MSGAVDPIVIWRNRRRRPAGSPDSKATVKNRRLRRELQTMYIRVNAVLSAERSDKPGRLQNKRLLYTGSEALPLVFLGSSRLLSDSLEDGIGIFHLHGVIVKMCLRGSVFKNMR